MKRVSLPYILYNTKDLFAGGQSRKKQSDWLEQIDLKQKDNNLKEQKEAQNS